MSQEIEGFPVAVDSEAMPIAGALVRFGMFELEPASGELRKAGVLIKLRPQPLKVLAFLARRPGRLITREELREDVWGGDTYVDFDQGLNYCIKEIRAALGDSAETPLYVETLPRRGYRFIAPVLKPSGGAERLGSVPRQPLTEPNTVRATRRPRQAWAIRLALTVIGVCIFGWLFAARTKAPPADWRRITFRRGSISAARFGPGREVVFSAAWDGSPAALFSANPGSPEARALSVADARLVGVTQRGEVAFIGTHPGSPPVLSRSPLAGGPAKQVLERASAADITADGLAFAVAHMVPGRGTVIEFPIGRAVAESNIASHLRISPDGERLAYIEHPVAGDDRGFVIVLAADGRRLAVSANFPSMEGLAWSARGDEVLFTASRSGSSSGLFALDLRGRERTVLPSGGRLVIHDVAPDGRLLLERCVVRGEVGLMSPEGERDLSWFDASSGGALAADGSRLLLTESGDAGGPDYAVYLRSTDGADPVRLGSGVATALSPDGRVALAIPIRDPDRIELLPVGPGESRALRHQGIVQYQWATFTPDGTRVVFSGGERNRNLRVWVGDLEGGKPRPITPEGLILTHDTVSPDGRFVVAPCRPLTWCLYPLDGSDPTPVPGISDLSPVAFEPSGKALMVRPRRAVVPLPLERLDLKSGLRTPWREIAPHDRVGVGGISGIAISRDGRSLVANYQRRLSELYLIEAGAPFGYLPAVNASGRDPIEAPRRD
jgi:DNA-binding winged helix-turn-helix (wHTH) protein